MHFLIFIILIVKPTSLTVRIAERSEELIREKKERKRSKSAEQNIEHGREANQSCAEDMDPRYVVDFLDIVSIITYVYRNIC